MEEKRGSLPEALKQPGTPEFREAFKNATREHYKEMEKKYPTNPYWGMCEEELDGYVERKVNEIKRYEEFKEMKELEKKVRKSKEKLKGREKEG